MIGAEKLGGIGSSNARFGSKADICSAHAHVCFGPIEDNAKSQPTVLRVASARPSRSLALPPAMRGTASAHWLPLAVGPYW